MGKLVSIVTTCLVVSSSRIFLIKTDWVDGSRDGPSWTLSSHTCIILLLLSLLPSTTGKINRHRNNDPSSVFVPKHINSEIWVRGINSLNFAMEEQHGPS